MARLTSSQESFELYYQVKLQCYDDAVENIQL